MKPHKLTLLICVAACLAYVYSCQATSNTLARWGGAATGAGLGAAVGGPLGAAGGAIAGDAVANAVVPQPVEPTTIVNAAPGSTVYATHASEPGWLAVWWPWIVTAALALRFRVHVANFARTLLTGGLGAAGMNLLAIVVGGKASDKAKEATMFHAMTVEAKKHCRKYPNRPVSPQNPVEFEPLPHEGGHGA